MQFDNTLFRASAVGNLMTEPLSKADKEAGNLSETTKTYLIEAYVTARYGRQKDISNKYIQKGLQCEEDSITLYSRVKKRFFKKNSETLSNQFISGTPDLFLGKKITEAEKVIDIKTSWDIFTFFGVHSKGMNKMYYWQLQAYMALTGAPAARLVYCLINTPETFILDEQRKLFYKMNAGTEENSDYKEACIELEKSMTYDDIDMRERVIEFSIERNDSDIEKLYGKVDKAREYLNKLESSLHPVMFLAQHKPALSATIVESIKV